MSRVSNKAFAGFPPPLKWIGGKRWFAPRMAGIYQPHRHRRLVEPFVGGLSIALYLRPQSALLSDINADLINFYQWLARGMANTMVMLDKRSVFKQVLDQFNALTAEERATSRQAALWFYYLCRHAYTGRVEYTAAGSLRAGYAGREGLATNKPAISQRLQSYAPLLRRWSFRRATFAELWAGTPTPAGSSTQQRAACAPAMLVAPNDFIYADPPYDGTDQPYAGKFTWADQEALATQLAAHPGPVVISNSSTPRIRQLYGDHGFTVALVPVEQSARVRKGQVSERVNEVLATRNLQPISGAH